MKKQTKTLKKKVAKKKPLPKKSSTRKTSQKKSGAIKKSVRAKKTAKKKTSKLNFKVVATKVKKKLGARDSLHVQELPVSYNETKLVLLPRDPESIFLYWDFSEETWQWIQELYSNHHSLWPKIRIHTQGEVEYFEMDVSLDAKKWYIHFSSAGQTLYAELGLMDEQGHFYLISKSQSIKVPRNSPSEVIDPDWVPVDYEEIYRLSGGQGIYGSSDILSSPDIVPKKK